MEENKQQRNRELMELNDYWALPIDQLLEKYPRFKEIIGRD